MPEGDTIYRVARSLDAALSGHVLTEADLRVPAFATAQLAGYTVTSVKPRGKHLLTALSAAAGSSQALVLHTTLGMDGSWRSYRDGQRWTGGPGWQIRAVLRTESTACVGYLLPKVELWPSDKAATALDYLGPDLLGPDWNPAVAAARLRTHPGRALGDALLDQRMLAGIGNVYKSEICFLAQVSPWTEVGALDDVDEVVAIAYRLLQANKTRVKRVTTGESRAPLWVYGRGGKPCRKCGTRIAVEQTGERGRARWTWWCASCQVSN